MEHFRRAVEQPAQQGAGRRPRSSRGRPLRLTGADRPLDSDRKHTVDGRLIVAGALRVVASKYREGVTETSLAQTCGCSQHALSKAVMRRTGRSLHALVTTVRLVHAMNMAVETDLKIDAIAFAVGYKSRKDRIWLPGQLTEALAG